MSLSSCKGCPRHWSGLRIAHCGCCHETFSTPANFDAHKPKRKKNGEPACGKPAEMTRERQDGTVVPVFSLTNGPHGVTWIGWREEHFDGETCRPGCDDVTCRACALLNDPVGLAEVDKAVQEVRTEAAVRALALSASATDVRVTPDGTVAWTESHVLKDHDVQKLPDHTERTSPDAPSVPGHASRPVRD